jgi:acyl carrier protein
MLTHGSIEEISRLVVETVQQSLASLGIEAAHVDGDFQLFSVEGFDSLSFVRLLMSFEQKCGRTLDLSAIDFNSIETIDALVSQLYNQWI